MVDSISISIILSKLGEGFSKYDNTYPSNSFLYSKIPLFNTVRSPTFLLASINCSLARSNTDKDIILLTKSLVILLYWTDCPI